MSHYIHGYVATTAILESVAEALPQARLVPLSQGLGFLPVIKVQVAQTDSHSNEPAYEQFETLTRRLAAIASNLSTMGPLAYIETEYFGGVGTQSAMVWLNGTVIFGPLLTDAAREGAINQALRCLGVVSGAHLDEFDAIGLGQHRSNEEWVESLGQA
jgi:hypothetical protein